MKRTLMLVRRELWEHPSLWGGPVVVAALLLLGAVFGRVSLPGGRLAVPPQVAHGLAQAIFALAVLAFGSALYVTMFVVLIFYASDCLYSERRDRSILFWKSMPVSDARTVLCKVLVAIVLVPLGVYLLTLLTSLIAFGIFSVRVVSSGSTPSLFWDTRAWLRIEGISLVSVCAATLWYAPITSYLMLVSAWVPARRNVYLWVFLPPIVVLLIERIAFGTHYLTTILLYRLGNGWQSSLVLSIEGLFTGPGMAPGSAGLAPVEPFVGLDIGRAFTNIDLWIGLAVAAAFVFAAIRIRRYRDDT